MNLQKEKLNLIRLIINTDNPILLLSATKLLQENSSEDFWNTFTKEQKAEVLQGLKELDNEELIEYDSFVAELRL